MKMFEIQFRYQNRDHKSVESTIRVDASSLSGAVGKGARQFVKGLDRKQKFDVNKNGLEIAAKITGRVTETDGEGSAQAAAS